MWPLCGRLDLRCLKETVEAVKLGRREKTKKVEMEPPLLNEWLDVDSRREACTKVYFQVSSLDQS